jgi:nucleotide-binding universal stress UspA family protein
MVDTEHSYQRKFLVIIDETEECDRAVTFAAYRVKRTGGTVVLMSVIDNSDFTQWMGVEEVMRAEALEEAERNLDTRIARIASIGDIKIESVVREGHATDEIERLIAEDKGIAILVLAASRSSDGPGPLVSHFAVKNNMHVLVTIVPGTMSDEEIIAVC